MLEAKWTIAIESTLPTGRKRTTAKSDALETRLNEFSDALEDDIELLKRDVEKRFNVRVSLDEG
jgi:hypothetical protein